ncbi:RnfABCDGE type electron transport complex subunit C [Mycoplasmatota bacterium]|nr:RnfABCDGE type electron transport complex subunit C [Mycoplasmatota bacterium]
MKLFEARKGIHIPGKKDDTSKLSSVKYISPEYVYIPLSAKGSDFEIYVKPGDKVKLGQKIAERTREKGLPLVKHSSVSGEVIGNERKLHRTGLPYVCIKIKNDFQDTPVEFTPISNLDEVDNTKLLEIMRVAGVVGLGGAGFPTFLKYQNTKDIDSIILNGAECEPYITADYRMMTEETDRVIDGLHIMMKVADAENGIIAIKKGKKAVYDLLVKAAEQYDHINVIQVPDEYPAGWERQIVYRTLKRSYETYPFECGVIVNNVSTSVAISDAIRKGIPVIERIVTVTGEAVVKPANYRVRIGTLASDLIKQSGGISDDFDDVRVISGGPMMGVTQKVKSLL